MSDPEDRFRSDVRDHRRRARILALQALFQIDVGGQSIQDAIQDVLAQGEESGVRGFVEELVTGVREELSDLDRRIQETSRNWSLDRMARVDRNSLRMGAYELLRMSRVPVAVVLNEAVELAKEYGDEGSGSFVNGVLDALRLAEVKSE